MFKILIVLSALYLDHPSRLQMVSNEVFNSLGECQLVLNSDQISKDVKTYIDFLEKKDFKELMVESADCITLDKEEKVII